MSEVGPLGSAAVSPSCEILAGTNGSINYRNVHDSLRLAHPLSPYSLNLNGHVELFPKLTGSRSLVDARIISSKAAQTSGSSRSFAILKVIVVEAILGVVDGGRTTLCQSRRRGQLGLRDDGSDEGVSKRAQSRGIAAHKGLGRVHPPF